MSQTIDLITHNALRELRAFTRETGQPTSVEQMDLAPIGHVERIEIDEEHITVTYNQTTTHRYNTKEVSFREWEYKYNDDPEFVAAIARVIELARKHVRDLPENVACPPGCAECCSGYEPFVSRADVQRIADHLGLTYEQTFEEYVVPRPSADDFSIGFLRKISEDIADPCVFLKGGKSGRFYCGIYEARPHDCRAFTPIGCQDVDETIPRRRPLTIGPPFAPDAGVRRRAKKRRSS